MVLDVAARQVLELRVQVEGLGFPAKRIGPETRARPWLAVVAHGHAVLIRPLNPERDRVATRCRESHDETAVSVPVDVGARRHRAAIDGVRTVVDGDVPGDLEGVVGLVMHHLDLTLVYRAVVISTRQK